MRQAFHSIKARASASTIAPDGGFSLGPEAAFELASNISSPFFR